MMTNTTLHTLADKLDQATGPDRELDLWVENTFGLACWGKGPWVPGEGHIYEKRVDPKPLTASLDAALGLAEQKLPGCGVELQRITGCAEWWCQITNQKNGDQFEAYDAPTAPLAVLKSLVKALIVMEE